MGNIVEASKNSSLRRLVTLHIVERKHLTGVRKICSRRSRKQTLQIKSDNGEFGATAAGRPAPVRSSLKKNGFGHDDRRATVRQITC
jgi:hypothetical protein